MGFLEMEYKRICSAKLAYKFHISKVSFWCDDDMIFQTEGQICIHAVSDYKNQSYKTQRWIWGKIEDTSVGQFKFKNHIKQLKNRQRSDFQR